MKDERVTLVEKASMASPRMTNPIPFFSILEAYTREPGVHQRPEIYISFQNLDVSMALRSQREKTGPRKKEKNWPPKQNGGLFTIPTPTTCLSTIDRGTIEVRRYLWSCLVRHTRPRNLQPLSLSLFLFPFLSRLKRWQNRHFPLLFSSLFSPHLNMAKDLFRSVF